MVRVAAACFCVVVGLAGGYVLWGDRAATLALALDRLSLEYDAVRAHAGSDVTLRSTLEALSSRVLEQGEALDRQTEALGRLVGAQDIETAATARECDEVQVRIQEQLESCLFARAKLERQVATAKQAASPPRAGTQTVTETIQVPQVPAKPAKHSRDDDDSDGRGMRLPFLDRDDDDDEDDRRPAAKDGQDGETTYAP
jgi:hypothetical protein